MSSSCRCLFKMEKPSRSAYIFILICDCVQCRLPQPEENRRGHRCARLSQAAMLASIINHNQDKNPPSLPLLSHSPDQRTDTLFKDLSQRQRQDIGLLRAFGVAGVGARGGQGHFHMHLTVLPLSFLHCGALIKAGGAAIAPKWPWSAFETLRQHVALKRTCFLSS